MDRKVMSELKKAIDDLLSKNRIDDAVPMMKQAANWGDLESQRQLMDIYLHEKYGYVYDPKLGYAYARLCAMNEDPEGMYELAKLNRDGLGCTKNEEQAFYFMKKASLCEYAFAYDELAMMLFSGKGTEKNLEQAQYWNLKALEQLGKTPTIEKHKRMIEMALEKAKK